MVVKELITKLGFNVDEKPVKKFEGGVNRLISLGKKLAATYLTLEAVKGLGRMVKSVADFGDQLDETSKKIGLSTDAIQKFGYAAKLSGVEQGTFNAGLKIFSRNIGEAKNGSKSAIQSFKDLNLDPKKFKSNEEGFLAVAEAISKVPDPARQAALAMGVFGRSGAEFLPVFEGGSEELQRLAQRFEALGGLMGPEAIKNAREFNDAWDDIGVIFKGVKNEIGSALLPALRDLALGFTQWYIENRKNIKQKIHEYIDRISKSLKNLKTTLKALAAIIAVLIGYQIVQWLISIASAIALVYRQIAFATAAWAAFLGVGAGTFLLILGAITLVLTSLYYIITDIIGFFQDKDSGLGRLTSWLFGKDLNGWSKMRAEMVKQWDELKTAVKNLLAVAGVMIEGIKSYFKAMVDDITSYLVEKFTSAVLSVKSLFDFTSFKLPSFSNGIGGALGGFVSERLGSLNAAPSLPIPSSVSKTSNNQSSLNYAPTINVNVQNADSKEIGEEVKRQTQDQLATLFRQTLRANQVGAV